MKAAHASGRHLRKKGMIAMSALHLKADMCGANSDVG
jgi:hypothetical protein